MPAMRFPTWLGTLPLLALSGCGNGPHFVHARLDVLSTQPLEQILGTLDQTPGYADGAARGREPWAHAVRARAAPAVSAVQRQADDLVVVRAAELMVAPPVEGTRAWWAPARRYPRSGAPRRAEPSSGRR